MANDELHRNEHERIRAEIDGTPDSEWNGVGAADVWWVLEDPDGNIQLSKQDSDNNMTVVQDGGGSDPAIITVDLTNTETGNLSGRTYYQTVIVKDSSGNLTSAELDPHDLTVRETPTDEVV